MYFGGSIGVVINLLVFKYCLQNQHYKNDAMDCLLFILDSLLSIYFLSLSCDKHFFFKNLIVHNNRSVLVEFSCATCDVR